MRLCSIASGSSGNSTYIGSDSTHILVDAGITTKRITLGLEELGVKPQELSGIFITHEHSDHIQGLGVFCRKYGIPVYASKGTLEGIRNYSGLGKVDFSLFHEIQAEKDFEVGDLTVKPFNIYHDANEPYAYRVESGKKKVAVATDLGHYDDYIVEHLAGLDSLVLEANHDVNMLQVGSYPYYLKQRILSDRGHLSNENSGRLLSRILHDDFKEAILGHLSAENNYARLAFETVKSEINLGDCPYTGSDFEIQVAKRDCLSQVVNI